MCGSQSKINISINYIESNHTIPVLSDYLRINFTKDYVKSLHYGLTDMQARKVLHLAAKWYKDDEGINSRSLIQLSKGVLSGLL